jgi:hypothetical protein
VNGADIKSLNVQKASGPNGGPELQFASIQPRLKNGDKGLTMERRDGIVEDVVGVRVVVVLLALLAIVEGALPCRTRMAARPFDGAGDVFGDRWCELHEFPARALEREAVLVFAARGIRPERGDVAAACDFHRLRPPGSRRAVGFRRQPLFDVPAIHGGIFRFFPELDALAQQNAVLVALLKFAANPGQAILSPDGAIVRLAEAIDAAGEFETMGDGFRSVMRLA